MLPSRTALALGALLVLGATAAGEGAGRALTELPDGPAWARHTITLDAGCGLVRLEGIAVEVGDGQATMLHVEGLGVAGVHVRPGGSTTVHATGRAVPLPVAVEAPTGEQPSRGAAFARDFRLCGGPGAFPAWSLHTSGIARDASGVLDATVETTERGTRVALWTLRDFRGTLNADASAPARLGPAGVGAAGAGASLHLRKEVTTEGPLFGAFIEHALADEYEIRGPRGAYASVTAMASGGTIDPSAIHGAAGEWVVQVKRGAGTGGDGRAMLVVADLAG